MWVDTDTWATDKNVRCPIVYTDSPFRSEFTKMLISFKIMWESN